MTCGRVFLEDFVSRGSPSINIYNTPVAINFCNEIVLFSTRNTIVAMRIDGVLPPHLRINVRWYADH